VEQTLVVDDPDIDPGWQFSPRMLLFLLPGYLQFTIRRAEQRDGLELTRQVWLSFASALVLIGVVVFPLGLAPAGRPFPWVIGLAVATGGFHVAESLALSKPLSCADPAALASTYRTRFFLAVALADALALLAFAEAVVLGRWWIYWLFLPFALMGLVRAAPTGTHLEADQENLRSRGCSLTLVGALRASAPNAPS
jgi:F0F1-type ATP synthase membrane subunit c/vacuolar-type H+-ATPase subunit K